MWGRRCCGVGNVCLGEWHMIVCAHGGMHLWHHCHHTGPPGRSPANTRVYVRFSILQADGNAMGVNQTSIVGQLPFPVADGAFFVIVMGCGMDKVQEMIGMMGMIGIGCLVGCLAYSMLLLHVQHVCCRGTRHTQVCMILNIKHNHGHRSTAVWWIQQAGTSVV